MVPVAVGAAGCMLALAFAGLAVYSSCRLARELGRVRWELISSPSCSRLRMTSLVLAGSVVRAVLLFLSLEFVPVSLAKLRCPGFSRDSVTGLSTISRP